MILKISILLFTFLILNSCSNHKTSSKNEEFENIKEKTEKIRRTTDTNNAGCDSTLWKHVYNASRLEVIDESKEVTGIVEEVGENDDGDTHILLKLDPGQESLINERNIKKKNGDIVAEIICVNDITKKKAKKPCEGYINNVQVPKTGAHVKLTGSYVLDTHNGWTEIHPVTKIEIIK